MSDSIAIITDEADILGIIKQADGEYRCRGLGETYAQFYQWLRTVSYVCSGEDWPWDYFHFSDPKDDAVMHMRWGQYISEDIDNDDDSDG